jgi:hypothetical protein
MRNLRMSLSRDVTEAMIAENLYLLCNCQSDSGKLWTAILINIVIRNCVAAHEYAGDRRARLAA